MNPTLFGSLAGGAVASLFGLFGLIVLAVILIPFILYILTLMKTLERCSPENRAMAPAMVWLLLIPLVGIVWHFMVVLNIAKSLDAEFKKRGISEEPEPGKKLGLIMCILICCTIIPILGILCSLGGLVCWIMYWIKISGFSGKIASPAAVAA